MVVIYTNEAGNVCVLVPDPNTAKRFGVGRIADKDVPTGTPYWLVERSYLPEDYSLQNGWVLKNMPEPDGYGKDSVILEEMP